MTFEEQLSLGKTIAETHGHCISDLRIPELFIAAGYHNATNMKQRKESRRILNDLFSSCITDNEDYFFRSEIRKIRKSLPYSIDKKTLLCCLVKPTMEGAHYLDQRDNPRIIYYPDMLISPYRYTPLEVLTRLVVSVVAHERTHLRNRDVENNTPIAVAEANATKGEIEGLRLYNTEIYNKGITYYSDKTKLIDFIHEL